jgi:hypothetical protein
MITEEKFLEEIKHVAHMRLINIPVAAAKDVFDRFSSFEEEDLRMACESITLSEDRFDFSKLWRVMSNKRAQRLESESTEDHISEARAAARFFDENRFAGECTRESCRGCPRIKNPKVDGCEVRSKEWLKNINTLLSVENRPKGEGKQMAEDIIHYMKNEFMGGIS